MEIIDQGTHILKWISSVDFKPFPRLGIMKVQMSLSRQWYSGLSSSTAYIMHFHRTELFCHFAPHKSLMSQMLMSKAGFPPLGSTCPGCLASAHQYLLHRKKCTYDFRVGNLDAVIQIQAWAAMSSVIDSSHSLLGHQYPGLQPLQLCSAYAFIELSLMRDIIEHSL